MATRARARRFWLLKSEPADFSFEDLAGAPSGRAGWDGVRNHQARNFLRDDVRVGDLALFYHSGVQPPGVAGIARVVRAAYPDPTQFDARNEHFDPRSRPGSPTWVQVDLEAVRPFPRFVPIDLMRRQAALRGMLLLRPGQRLSVQPVTPAEWRAVLRLGGLDPRAV